MKPTTRPTTNRTTRPTTDRRTPTEKETDEVTATEPTPNGAGTLGESTTDKFWLASDDSEQLPGAEGPGTARRLAAIEPSQASIGGWDERRPEWSGQSLF